MELSTIQKRGKLNVIEHKDEMGPGGAYHKYAIKNATDGVTCQDIVFQKGPRNVPGSVDGVLDVDLLEIVRDRMMCFQAGEFATRENSLALTNIEQALLWLNKRTEDRIERSVLGTYEK